MRLEEVAKAVGGGYCRLQMPLTPALAVRGTVAGRRLGAWRGGGGTSPPCRTQGPLWTISCVRLWRAQMAVCVLQGGELTGSSASTAHEPAPWTSRRNMAS